MGPTDGIQLAIEAAKRAGDANLQMKLLDESERTARLQEENAELRARVAELEARLALRGIPTFDSGAYWTVDEKGQRDGPFCARCYDVNSLFVRVDARPDDTYWCHECKDARDIG